MNIVCAESVLCAREAFSPLGDVRILPDRNIRRDDLMDATALIIRSKTRVTPDLLDGTPVQFVATATAGSDHLDIPFLAEAGIAWTASPGCNANAVAEYTATALTRLAAKTATPLPGRTLGVVGCGQVGSRVVQKAGLLGMRVLKNDPPLVARDPSAAPDFLPLDDLLPQADFLTLHTPLTRTAPFPSLHLAGCRLFGRLPPGACFLNTSRGAVTDTDALAFAVRHRHIAAFVLDVWEGEPAGLPSDLAAAATAWTPHIAGYSLEGLLNGTLHCHRELCHYLETEPRWTPPPAITPPPPVLQSDAAGLSDTEILTRILNEACPLAADTLAWRAESHAATDDADLRHRFDRFRKQHLLRREFAAHRVYLDHAPAAVLECLAALGFQICARPE